LDPVTSRDPVVSGDLDRILRATSPGVWDSFRGARLFLTGGTGFFGKWILESWVRAEEEYGLGSRVVVLSRDPDAFRRAMPALSGSPTLTFLRGDVLDFDLPNEGFTHVIHAATPVDPALERSDPEGLRRIAVDGTRRVLEWAERSRKRPRILFTSSGAVYGPQPAGKGPLTEDDPLPEDATSASAYARGKRDAERLCREAAARGTSCTIARCFAFAGPYLPLDREYAFGNFLRDALGGGPVRVSGDGSAIRSYLYASDLASWLLTLLSRGESGRAYNVGSDEPVSIGELAGRIARRMGCGLEIAGKPAPGLAPSRYVPSIERARTELGLAVTVPLDEAIDRTARFLESGARGRMERA
jgi:dTDP-glucose 4,6-dehydratase